MGRKRICMVTNWYPTEKNPYQGVFFKEQAMALKEHFDFLVIHYTENRKVLTISYLFQKIFSKHYSVKKLKEEENTVEYQVVVNIPISVMLFDIMRGLYINKVKHATVQGIGKYTSETYKRIKQKSIQKVFETYFKDSFDVLYCVDAQQESYTLQVISEAMNRPYVVSEHAPFPWPGTTIKDVEHEAIKKANLFMAISYDKIRQVLLQNIQLSKIAYVGNMVDESKFNLRKGNNEIKTFIMVAANSFYKNYPLFIRVFDRLTEITDIEFKVMVVGYGSNKGYSKNAELLEKQILNSKFAEYVELIPEVSHDKINEVYERADAFVMTSIQEGMPVSAIEAACCGLPIFSTMCGGVEDYVNEKLGRIYKVIDSEAFAIGLKDYLEDKMKFNAEYIRERAIELFGKRVFVDRMTKEFDEVISNWRN